MIEKNENSKLIYMIANKVLNHGKWLLFFVLAAFHSNLQAQTLQIDESFSFSSTILEDTVKYSVLLPAGYETSKRSYPVVYLLHGYTNDETTWIRHGKIQDIVSQGLQAGDLIDFVLVMPDGSDTRYCNDYRGRRRWRDMFIGEFIPYIENQYRVQKGKAFRAVTGQSMGGYGSLMLAMKHPEAFSSCVALGAALYADEDLMARSNERYDKYWGAIYGEKLRGSARITSNWKAHNPLDLVRSVPTEKLNTVRFYIDCGDDDIRTKGNSILHLLMIEKGISHEYRVSQGGHDWDYWRKGILQGLKFICDVFSEKS